MTVRQLMLMGMLAVGVAGCPAPQGTCEQDSDCEGGMCDPTCNCCLYPPEDSCSPACQPWEQCNVGTCEARYTGIEISSHSNGAHVKLGAPVPVAAKPILATGKTESGKALVKLKVTAPGGVVTEHAMTWNEDAYVAPVTFSEPGEYQAVATVGGLSSAAVTLVTDTVGPTLNVKIGQAPKRDDPKDGTSWKDTDTDYATAWRRDETATVFVSSPDADVQTTSVEVSVRIAGGEAKQYPVESGSGCAGNPAWCGVAQIPLWEPQMKEFRGNFTVTATGQDSAGNQSVGTASDTNKVTRWKWAYQVTGSAATLGAPAVSSTGMIAFGTNSVTSGSVTVLNHQGEFQWASPIGRISHGVSIGKKINGSERVYAAAATDGNAELHALDLADSGASIANCSVEQATVPETGIGIGFTKYGTENEPFETATAVVSGQLISLRPGASQKCRDVFVGSLSTPQATVAMKGAAAFYGDGDPAGTLHGYTFSSSGWSNSNGWPVPAQKTSRSLVITKTHVIGASAQGTVFSIPFSGGKVLSWDYTPESNTPSWSPVIDSDGAMWVGLNSKKVVKISVGQESVSKFLQTSGVVESSPLLGKGEFLYAAGTDGVVTAFRRDDGSVQWSAPDVGSIEASVNIDCPRQPDGSTKPGQHGVLYVLNGTGKLHAFIVDSRGIDTTAPWPKYQRDPRNTGNAETDMSEFNCD